MDDRIREAQAKWMALYDEWALANAEHLKFARLAADAFASGKASAGTNPLPGDLRAADLWQQKAEAIWKDMDKVIQDLDG